MEETSLRSVNSQTESEMDCYWSHRADSYSQLIQAQFHSQRREAWEAEIFDGLNENRVLNVLDIGTGPGFFAILAALRGHRVTAVDMNAEMLCRARENVEALNLDVTLLQVGAWLPFAPESFDLIVCRDVTWTLTEPETQLRAWASLLSPGGTLRYFDAEWYHHLNPERMHEGEVMHAHQTAANQGYARSGEMEASAAKLPMTFKKRPEWDARFWRGEGFECEVKTNLNEAVYSEEECLRYCNFPCFRVTVRRNVL